jgi:hypothetical protein
LESCHFGVELTFGVLGLADVFDGCRKDQHLSIG